MILRIQALLLQKNLLFFIIFGLFIICNLNAKSLQKEDSLTIPLAKDFQEILDLNVPQYSFFDSPKIIYALRGKIGNEEQRAYLIVRPVALGACFDYSVELQLGDLNVEDWFSSKKLASNAILYAIPNRSALACKNFYEQDSNNNSKEAREFLTYDTINTALEIGIENNALVIQGIWRDDANNAHFHASKDFAFYGQKFSFRQDKDLALSVFVIAGESLSFTKNKGVINNPQYFQKSLENNLIDTICDAKTFGFNIDFCVTSHDEMTKYYYRDLFIPKNQYNTDVRKKFNQIFAFSADNLEQLQESRKHDVMKFVQKNNHDEEAEYFNEFKIRYLDSKILVLEELSFVSKKGYAHPYYTVDVHIYDILTGKKLSCKLEDIFLLGNNKIQREYVEKQLLALLTSKLRKKDYDKLVFKEKLPLEELPQTFIINSTGIEFVWQLYDIAPYSSGIIRVHVDFNELRDYVLFSSNYSYLF